MKIKYIAGMTILLLGIVGCKKSEEPTKIIDALPLKTDEVIYPANAVQQMQLLRIQGLRIIVTGLNQLLLTPPAITQLQQACPNYTFSLNDSHFGSASYTVQFQDSSNSALCPVETSTSTLKFITISGSGNSSLFSYTDTSLLTLDTVGNINSPIHLTGNTSFTGTGAAAAYSIPFTISSPGSRVNLEGLRDGTITVNGTGVGGSLLTMSLRPDSNHNLNGDLSWDGQQGQIHVNTSGTGFVVTNNARVPIN